MSHVILESEHNIWKMGFKRNLLTESTRRFKSIIIEVSNIHSCIRPFDIGKSLLRNHYFYTTINE